MYFYYIIQSNVLWNCIHFPFLMVLGLIVRWRLKNKIAFYNKSLTGSGFSGKEIAEKMLRDNGIFDVAVNSVQGFLTDHYDPIKKIINLSPEVYDGKNIAAAAIAAHECGHAVQHSAGLFHAYAAKQTGAGSADQQ